MHPQPSKINLVIGILLCIILLAGTAVGGYMVGTHNERTKAATKAQDVTTEVAVKNEDIDNLYTALQLATKVQASAAIPQNTKTPLFNAYFTEPFPLLKPGEAYTYKVSVKNISSKRIWVNGIQNMGMTMIQAFGYGYLANTASSSWMTIDSPVFDIPEYLEPDQVWTGDLIKIFVPADTQPGTYSSTVTISGSSIGASNDVLAAGATDDELITLAFGAIIPQ